MNEKSAQSDLLSKSGMEIWRESIAHLRYLSSEFWKTVALFHGLMFAILLTIFAIVRFHAFDKASALLVLVLSIIGLLVGAIGRYTVKRVRAYYVQMLAKKSLLEHDLGFYETKFSDSQTDLAFPWRITLDAIAEIKKDFDGWVTNSNARVGTIARYQFWIFDVTLALFAIGVVGALVRLVR